MKTKACAAAVIAAMVSTGALSQSAGNYPNRVVKFIVPVAAGGTVDIVARTFAQRLTESLGQQVIVENRPSASSLVGTQLVAKAPPDGYTLLATSTKQDCRATRTTPSMRCSRRREHRAKYSFACMQRWRK